MKYDEVVNVYARNRYDYYDIITAIWTLTKDFNKVESVLDYLDVELEG
jgi:hypothetical protein